MLSLYLKSHFTVHFELYVNTVLGDNYMGKIQRGLD